MIQAASPSAMSPKACALDVATCSGTPARALAEVFGDGAEGRDTAPWDGVEEVEHGGAECAESLVVVVHSSSGRSVRRNATVARR